MNPSIFKAYDIRGVYPDEINDIAAEHVARACVHLFKKATMVIAHDCRHGSEKLAKKLIETITGESRGEITVVEVGLSTTPMFYFLVNHLSAVGGCMVTASHNPKNYNGFKIVREGAHMITGTEMKKIIDQTEHELH
jgi:phosphomannomutase